MPLQQVFSGTGNDGLQCVNIGGGSEATSGWYCEWGRGTAAVVVLVVGLLLIIWVNLLIWREPDSVRESYQEKRDRERDKGGPADRFLEGKGG